MSSEAITRNDLKNILNEVLPSEPVEADYVVEQGTSGIWTYRKWKSGIAECWGTQSGTTTLNTQWGSTYISGVISINFPTLFVSDPVISVFNTKTGQSTTVIGTSVLSSSSCVVQLMRGTNSGSSVPYNLMVIAKGRWK